MTGWRARARQLGVLPSSTKPTKPAKPTKPVPAQVSWVLWVLLKGPEPFSRDLARDPFAERAAIRERDGGLDRAEALAVEGAARTLSLPLADLCRAVTPEAPALDAEGLPCQPCTRCSAGAYWKPARLPFEGEGWRCSTCHPPGADQWRHAVSVPTGGGRKLP